MKNLLYSIFLIVFMTSKIIAASSDTSRIFSSSNLIIDLNQDITSIFSTDLDKDGDIDIVSATSSEDRIDWYESDGDTNPTWTAHNITTSSDSLYCDGPRSVYAGDLDKDGDIDIVAACTSNSRILWYKNDGSANPSFSIHLFAYAAQNYDVFIEDIDKDNTLDVVSASYNYKKVSWFKDEGNSTSSGVPIWNEHHIAFIPSSSIQGPWDISAADMDGDGDMDVVCSGSAVLGSSYDGVFWLENDGSTTPVWTKHRIGDLWTAQEISVADLDKDGDNDLIAISKNNAKIYWYENTGDAINWPRTDISTSYHPSDVTTADINNDGHIDVISTSSDNITNRRIAWYKNNGNSDPGFSIETIESTKDAGLLFAADVDKDGDLDIIVEHGDNNLVWYENMVAFKPTDISLTLTSTELYENTANNTFLGLLSSTDRGSTEDNATDTHTYALVSGEGSDHNNLFTITNDSLFSASIFNYETNSVLSIRIKTTDSEGLTYIEVFTINILNVNEAPIITNISNVFDCQPDNCIINMDENILPITTITATDEDSLSTLTYSISGTNANDVSIDTAGVITFNNRPNYEELIIDSDQNNYYQFTLTVGDDGQLTDTQAFTVYINDAEDVPVITSHAGENTPIINVNEHTLFVTEVISQDEDSGAQLEYAISGVDKNKFDFEITDSNRKNYKVKISFKSEPDYENPIDDNLDNKYNLEIKITDNTDLSDTQPLIIQVVDVEDIIGCMDENACNYNPDATESDGNCLAFDCLDACGGPAEFDECGICDGTGIPEGECDCEGNINEYSDDCMLDCPSFDEINCNCGMFGGVEYSDQCIIDDCQIIAQWNESGCMDDCIEDCSLGITYLDKACEILVTDAADGIHGEDCWGLDMCINAAGLNECESEETEEMNTEFNNFPDKISLEGIYPNPFNPITTIQYELPQMVHLKMSIYNLSGKEIEILYNGTQYPGYHSINWNADSFPSGIYFIKMITGEYENTEKLMFVK